MNAVLFIFYNLFVVPLLMVGFYTGSFFNAKMKEGRIARRKQFVWLRNEIAKAPAQKRILFHCTSAGEWLQALPVIEKMKAIDPGLFIMVSFFSPSGYKFAKNPPEVSLKFYLPLDSWFSARKLLKLLKPELWIISKFDIWPNHVLVASGMKIPVVIISATLSADSGRDKGISKILNKPLYSTISHFFPISEADKQRFQALVPDETRYTIAGDTRYDHVYNRGQKAMDAADISMFAGKALTLIAGSTWPADEKHILPAMVKLLNEFSTIRAIVVPHELQESHLREIESVFTGAGIATTRYTAIQSGQQTHARVVIFNTIGMLARLYKQTDIAFIGGSFGKGTHNVMEPAIFGQPVLFGPNHLNSHEAGELLIIGAAFTVHGEDEFFEKTALLIRDDKLRATMGEKARNLIHDNIGATAKIINKLKTYGIIPQVYTN